MPLTKQIKNKQNLFDGFSIPRNKELMRIFKDLDLVEQLGSGIPRILKSYSKACFHFSDNFLRMVFPSAEPVHATEQVTEQAPEQVETLIAAIDTKEYSRAEIMELVEVKHRPTFLYNYLQPAIALGFIELTIPGKPNSSKQKYRLTQKGRTKKAK